MKKAFGLAAVCTVALATVAWADKAPPKSKVGSRPVAVAPGESEISHQLVGWSSVPGWDIFVDPTAANGCVAVAEFEDASVVYIGIDMTSGDGYVTSLNPTWGDIEDGESYPVEISLDESVYEGDAIGLRVGDLPGADAAIGDPDFFGELVAAQTLTLAHDGNEVMKVDLAGAAEAMLALIACQDEQNAASGG